MKKTNKLKDLTSPNKNLQILSKYNNCQNLIINCEKISLSCAEKIIEFSTVSDIGSFKKIIINGVVYERTKEKEE